MDKLKLHTPDFTEANIAKLAELFPHCITENTDENGDPKRAIDFDLLKQELSSSLVEGTQERYQLNWVGKKEALLTANAPIAKTLRPNREESVDFDSTQNLYIEGDNLDALKLLQETYLNQVKMIYIDPPYNTGNDFIYEDDFAEDTESYKLRSNQADEDGNRLVANTESNGRFHSDWLSMMYSRLRLARNLLKDDGVIFISIDDNEQANLKRLCDEVFGEENFVACIAVKLSEASGVKMAHVEQRIPKLKEYVLFYKKTEIIKINPPMIDKGKWDSEYRTVCLGLTSEELKFIKIVISDESRTQADLDSVENLLKKISFQSASTVCKQETKQDLSDEWLFSNAYRILQVVTLRGGAFDLARIKKESFDTNLAPVFLIKTAKNKIYLIKSDFSNESTHPRCQILFADEYLQINSGDFWSDIKTTGLDNEGDVDFKNGKKPLKLVKRCINLLAKSNDIILDFFSGSATTAHAVMQLNAEDGGKRKFILVQIPEKTNSPQYPTIAEIGKERIRKAGQKIKTENADKEGIDRLDIGFRVLKIDSSNMNEVYYSPDQTNQADLLNLVDNIRADRNDEDLLFQVLLDWGVDLTLPIVEKTIDDKTVFTVADNEIVACFDRQGGITEDFIKELATREPRRVVFCDSGFADDSVKINIEQVFKSLSPQTELKTI